jgi:hypothetical protein
MGCGSGVAKGVSEEKPSVREGEGERASAARDGASPTGSVLGRIVAFLYRDAEP